MGQAGKGLSVVESALPPPVLQQACPSAMRDMPTSTFPGRTRHPDPHPKNMPAYRVTATFQCRVDSLHQSLLRRGVAAPRSAGHAQHRRKDRSNNDQTGSARGTR